jgi:hypothetical protein
MPWNINNTKVLLSTLQKFLKCLNISIMRY